MARFTSAGRTLPKTMRMSISWNDHLRYEYAALTKVPALASLPFELLEKILEEVSSNSVSGLRAFAAASRLCRALARPYHVNGMRCEVTFAELLSCNDPRCYATVALREINNHQTLEITGVQLKDCTLFPNVPRAIQSVLGNMNTYKHVQYLDHPIWGVSPLSLPALLFSAAGLDTINELCPMLSKLTLGLPDINQFCFSNGLPRTYIGVSQNIVNALSRFPNLRHLQLHFYLDDLNLDLLYAETGCRVAHHMYSLVQASKQGVRLDHLNIVFSTLTILVFGALHTKKSSYQLRLEATMSCEVHCEEVVTSCNAPIFREILDRKKHTERLLGSYTNRRIDWQYGTGPRWWKHVAKEWPHPSAKSLFLAKLTTLPELYFWRTWGWLTKASSCCSSISHSGRRFLQHRSARDTM